MATIILPVFSWNSGVSVAWDDQVSLKRKTFICWHVSWRNLRWLRDKWKYKSKWTSAVVPVPVAGTYMFQKAVEVFQLLFSPGKWISFKKIHKFTACSWEFHVVDQWVVSVVLPQTGGRKEWMNERGVGLEDLKRSLLIKKILFVQVQAEQDPCICAALPDFSPPWVHQNCMSKREISELMQGDFGFWLSLLKSFNQNIFSLFIYYSK